MLAACKGRSLMIWRSLMFTSFSANSGHCLRKVMLFQIIAFLLTSFVSYGRTVTSLLIPSDGNFAVYDSGSRQFLLNESRLAEMNLYNDIRHVASGNRAVSASDDPAVTVVAERMNAYINSILQEAMNEEDYRNYLNYCEAMIGQDIDILHRIRNIAVRSSSAILGPDDREAGQSEISQLRDQIDINAGFSRFNKKPVIPDLNSRSLGIDGIDVIHDVEGAIKDKGEICLLDQSAGI
jgi:hypothetical protein